MLKKLFDAEPVLVRALVLAVFMVANHFGAPLPEWAKFAVNLAAFGLYALITRAKVTPNHQVVTTTADYPKELSPMPTFEEFLAGLKAKAEAALQALEAFNVRHPEVVSLEAEALKTGVTDLAAAAKTEVAAVAPKSAQDILDDAIAAVEAKAETAAAQIASDRDAQIATLQSAKAAVAA